MEGMKKVLTIVVQCAACASNRPGEFQLTAVMPAKSCAMLIGVKGQNIKDLVKTSGAHVHVTGEALGFTTGSGPGGDKLVTVKGNYAGLENAILRLVECVLEFQDQPWFPDWVVRTNADRYEPPEEGDEKGSRAPKAAPAAKASSPADDSGIPTGNADMMPEMAAMANMCNMMMPMQCMQLMGMMPFFGMPGMCMPMMGLAACGMPGMLSTDSEGSPGGGATAGRDGVPAGMRGMGCAGSAAGVGSAGGVGCLGAGGASGASRMRGAGGVRGLGAGSSGSGPPLGARLAAMASGSGAAGKRAKPLVYNNVPAGIIARQAKGLLNAGKLSSGHQGFRSSLPAAHEKSMERLVQENAAKEQTASARESPAELVPTVWEIGGSAQEPEPVSSDNPPDFDEELLTEEEMARKIAEQRDEIERLRKGLSSKTQLPGHRWY